MRRPSLMLLLLGMMTMSVQAQKDTLRPEPVLSPLLKLRMAQPAGEDSIDLVLAGGNPKMLKGWGVRLIRQYGPGNSFHIRIKANRIADLVANRLFRFADLYLQPKEELTTGSLDITTNRANFSQQSCVNKMLTQ